MTSYSFFSENRLIELRATDLKRMIIEFWIKFTVDGGYHIQLEENVPGKRNSKFLEKNRFPCLHLRNNQE